MELVGLSFNHCIIVIIVITIIIIIIIIIIIVKEDPIHAVTCSSCRRRIIMACKCEQLSKQIIYHW